MSNFNPKISIIVPVYNGANYLKEAIESALAQTYKNIEIIVVNDGSNDAGLTEKTALSFGNKISYFSKPNGGTSSALNLGIKNMTGEYFSWLSHDDTYYPNKLKAQINVLSKLENKNTIMMTDLDGIDENYKKIYVTDYMSHIEQYPPRIHSNIHPIIYNQTHGCTLLIPKICFDVVGLFDEDVRVAQDFEFFYRAFLEFPHHLIPKVLVTARDSSNRQGKRSKSSGNVEYSQLFIKMIENLSEEEYKLLAPSKMDFYNDMTIFFNSAEYTIAADYIKKKFIRNLQVSSYDLIGNKFNGHNLHLLLRENMIDSKHLVVYKQSNDKTTYTFDFFKKDATKHFILLKEFINTDIIHLHTVHNFIDKNYLPLISKLKPTILTLHDPYFLAGHCVHHFDCEKWKTHCNDCPYLNEMFTLDSDYSSLNFRILSDAVQNSSLTAIVASKWMEDKVKLSPIWKNKKVYRLPFGINQEIFCHVDSKLAKRNLGIDENNLVLMFRTVKDSFKGLDIIKESLRNLKIERKVTLISVDQKGLLSEFESKYQIIEKGWINNDSELSELYQACDLFLMPSKQETFGMMAIEAMSCGKMVLAINGPGTAVSEVINSPFCGLAVNEENYGVELQRLLNNTDEIIERGKKSEFFAKDNYSSSVYIKNMINIYNEVINEHKVDVSSALILSQLEKNENNYSYYV